MVGRTRHVEHLAGTHLVTDHCGAEGRRVRVRRRGAACEGERGGRWLGVPASGVGIFCDIYFGTLRPQISENYISEKQVNRGRPAEPCVVQGQTGTASELLSITIYGPPSTTQRHWWYKTRADRSAINSDRPCVAEGNTAGAV